MTFESIIRPVVEHPKRGWIVITATFVIGVVFTWPSVDYYFTAAQSHRNLDAELEEGKITANRLDLYQKQLERETVKLRSLEARAVSTDKVEHLRNQITEWVKESGCQLRPVKLAEVQLRPWYEVDHPLENRVHPEKDKKSPFKLRQQPLNLLLTGEMERIGEFLARLSEQEMLMHTANLQLRRSAEDSRMVELEIELILFDLVQGDPNKN